MNIIKFLSVILNLVNTVTMIKTTRIRYIV